MPAIRYRKSAPSISSANMEDEASPPPAPGRFRSRLRLPFSNRNSDAKAKERSPSPPSDDKEDAKADEKRDEKAKCTPPKNSPAMECHVCKISLGIRRLKHHCRNCGNSVCNAHSRNQLPLPKFGILRTVRVCDKCTKEVLQQRAGLRKGASIPFPEESTDKSIGGVLYSSLVEEQDDTMDTMLYIGSLKMTGRSLATRNLNSNMMIWKDRMLIVTPAEMMCFKHSDSGLGEVRTTVHMTDILHIYINESHPRILTVVRADGRIFRIRAKDKDQCQAIHDVLQKTHKMFQDALYKLQRGVLPEDFSISSITLQHTSSLPEVTISAFPNLLEPLHHVGLYPTSIVRLYVAGPMTSGVAVFTYDMLTKGDMVLQQCENPTARSCDDDEALEVHLATDASTAGATNGGALWPVACLGLSGLLFCVAILGSDRLVTALGGGLLVAAALALVLRSNYDVLTSLHLLLATRGRSVLMGPSWRSLNVTKVLLTSKDASCDDEHDASDMDVPDDDIYGRFLEGMSGNVTEARRRYFAMVNWRKDEDIDTILARPHPQFDAIKESLVLYVHKRDKMGRMIQIEKTGTMKKTMQMLTARGVSEAEVLHHTAFMQEYYWKVLDNRAYPNGMQLRIIDLKGISMDIMSSDVFSFVKKVGLIAGNYNPERMFKVFIVNPPRWFGMIWKVAAPMVNPKTRDKTIVVSGEAEIKKALLEYVDADCLPVEYGGSCACDGGCMTHSPEEVELHEFVTKLNAGERCDELLAALRDRPHPRAVTRISVVDES
ncbi:hypothetical protein, variant [Saprolegnia diclina VS20]|nr:hypothetical protein, variant [Saprolegnia diclina VS20]EQC34143.1 hypothetical protein, variant [Saprolegnia diclina VS20]|eukprot:XP_008612455.1 hypothetical protein, variant [Saprolegnia diclina VS20]